MNRMVAYPSPKCSFQRNRSNSGSITRKNFKGGWSVPPEYTPYSSDEETQEETQEETSTGSGFGPSFFFRKSISEHDPKPTRQSNKTHSSAERTKPRISNRFRKCFPQLDFFRQNQIFAQKKNQEQALVKVVKKIWEDGRGQRLDMMTGWTGEIGLALFIPFDWEVIDTDDSSISETESTYSFSAMVVEDDPDAQSSPPILSCSQIGAIHSNLPHTVALMTWSRAYSLVRDGDLFDVMVKKVANYQHTLTVIRTSDGDILGGYADTAWVDTMSPSAKSSRGFFGGGRSFLFGTNPDLSIGEEEILQDETFALTPHINNKDNISFFSWTGLNEYCQICDKRRGFMGMGGGGSFGWCIQDNFTSGSSGPCLTFNNPSLTKGLDGHFKIVDIDIYGFKNMSERISFSSQRQLSLSTNRDRKFIRSTSNASSLASMLE